MGTRVAIPGPAGHLVGLQADAVAHVGHGVQRQRPVPLLPQPDLLVHLADQVVPHILATLPREAVFQSLDVFTTFWKVCLTQSVREQLTDRKITAKHLDVIFF